MLFSGAVFLCARQRLCRRYWSGKIQRPTPAHSPRSMAKRTWLAEHQHVPRLLLAARGAYCPPSFCAIVATSCAVCAALVICFRPGTAQMEKRKPKPKDSVTTMIDGRAVKVVKPESVKRSASRLKDRFAAAFAYLKDK